MYSLTANAIQLVS